MSVTGVPVTIEETEAVSRAFRLCFGSPAGRDVIDNLMVFCHFRTPLQASGSVLDPNALLVAEGKRQVFLHILKAMKLTHDQILAVYRRERFAIEEDEDAA
jgi:hypothetical protein